MDNILFFDATCPLCCSLVRSLIAKDQEKRIFFAPLKGQTAEELLRSPPEETLIFWEKGKTYVYFKAIFRLFWVLGGFWRLVGFLAWVPFPSRFLYAILAKWRHSFPTSEGILFDSSQKKRLLK